MALTLVTAPASEPLTLAEVKAHLRVDLADEDVLITALIQAAREHVENFTHRALITQAWDLMLDGFPRGDAIWLPKAPAISVTSVSYVDSTGASQVWSPALYITDIPVGPTAQRARIAPAYNQYYPVTRSVMNAVTVRFMAGYGASAAVPSAILASMKLLIAHWYQSREAVLVGLRAAAIEIPVGIDALLWPYKAF